MLTFNPDNSVRETLRYVVTEGPEGLDFAVEQGAPPRQVNAARRSVGVKVSAGCRPGRFAPRAQP